MTNSFVEALKHENNFGVTENGALSLKSTTDSLVDLFGTIGALRSRSAEDIEDTFSKAFAEDKLLATKMSFYARNVRGGLGERNTVRVIWSFLANNYPDIIRKNLVHIANFGRWDDMWIFIGTPVEKDMWAVVKDQFAKDLADLKANKPISLLAKWMKSVNTSSKESVAIGRRTAKELGLSYDAYRRILSKMRRHIDVTEVKMSNKEWDKIKYSAVPSRAMNIYRKAFWKNDAIGFKSYLDKVSKGEEKINSGTLFPYDITEKYMQIRSNIDTVLEEQWKALPNYVDSNDNVLIMADVSGSMCGRPMATSVGLAIYFAERNKGVFHNLFMTFSEAPDFVELKGDSLREKIYNARTAHWQMNTNLEAAFKRVLSTAVEHKIPAEDMPKSIVVISDMEIDQCSDCRQWDFYESMKNLFAENGYVIPNVIFWNVDARRDTFHARSDFEGVQLASGQSVSVFKSVLECVGLTPYKAMVKTLSDPAYDVISI